MAKLVRIMWVPVLLSLLYTGWVFWQRHTTRPAPKRARAEVAPLERYGNSVQILHFYTRTGEIAPGRKALLCYGVVNAAVVRLDPPAEKLWPALTHCFEVSPSRSTHYTLIAEGKDQTTVSASLDIAVKP